MSERVRIITAAAAKNRLSLLLVALLAIQGWTAWSTNHHLAAIEKRLDYLGQMQSDVSDMQSDLSEIRQDVKDTKDAAEELAIR